MEAGISAERGQKLQRREAQHSGSKADGSLPTEYLQTNLLFSTEIVCRGPGQVRWEQARQVGAGPSAGRRGGNGRSQRVSPQHSKP